MGDEAKVIGVEFPPDMLEGGGPPKLGIEDIEGIGGPPVGRPPVPVWVFWFAQLTRIAREPNHSPFIVAIACSASALSLKRSM